MFDRVVVISLARRPDRLAEFMARASAAWPGQAIEVLPAIDGREHAPPSWWKTTPGAWGCYLSHKQAVALAVLEGVERLLVFEDDATFVPDFPARLAALPVPADADWLYLGGQHLRRPEPVVDGLVRGTNVNRTHAYALLGRRALAAVRAHLEPDSKRWTARNHVDHHYGILHQSRALNVYAASPWLCGQAAGLSDVDGRKRPERVWR